MGVAWSIPFAQELLCLLLMWACAMVVVACRKGKSGRGRPQPDREAPPAKATTSTSTTSQKPVSVDISALLKSARAGCPGQLALGLFRHTITPLAPLGAGGCAQVHLCTIRPSATSSRRGSITAAIKCVPFSDVVSPSGSLQPDLTTPAAAIAEVSANLAVADYPQLFVPLLAYHLHTSGALLAFQPCGNGQTLLNGVCQPLAAAGYTRMPAALLDYYLRFFVAACHVMHTKGLVNLDVKPGNVLLTGPFGQPRMADLGSAACIGMLVSDVSTPLYAAPQLAPGSQGVPAHPKYDYWAIVIAIIELFYLAADAPLASAKSAHTMPRSTPSLDTPAPVTPNPNTSQGMTPASVRSTSGSSSPDSLSVADQQFLQELSPTVAAYQLLRWGCLGALQQQLLTDGMSPALVTLLATLVSACLPSPGGTKSDTASSLSDSSSSSGVGVINPPLVKGAWDHLYQAVQTYLEGCGIPPLAPGEEPLPGSIIAALSAAATRHQQPEPPAEEGWAEDDSWWQQPEAGPNACSHSTLAAHLQHQQLQRLKVTSSMMPSVPEEGQMVTQGLGEIESAVEAPGTPLAAAGEPWARRSSSSGGYRASDGSNGQDGRSSSGSSNRRASLMSWGSTRSSRCSDGGLALGPTTSGMFSSSISRRSSMGGAGTGDMVTRQESFEEEDEEVLLRTPLLSGAGSSSSSSSHKDSSKGPVAQLLQLLLRPVEGWKSTRSNSCSPSIGGDNIILCGNTSTMVAGGTTTSDSPSMSSSSRFTTKSKADATNKYNTTSGSSSKDAPCTGVVLSKRQGDMVTPAASGTQAAGHQDSGSSSSSMLSGMACLDSISSSDTSDNSSSSGGGGVSTKAAPSLSDEAASMVMSKPSWGKRMRKGAGKLLRRVVRCS